MFREHGSDALRRCQIETSDYKAQVMEIKHQLTSERFERARAEEVKRYRVLIFLLLKNAIFCNCNCENAV